MTRAILAPFGCAVLLLAACGGTGPAGAGADPTAPTAPVVEPWAAVLTIPSTPLSYANRPLPASYAAPPVAALDNTPAGNRVTDWGATLGRVLFFDRALSVDNTVACANCHQPARGWSDAAVLSVGVGGRTTARHSMSLVNAAFYRNGRFFWDERAATLEAQVLQPIEDPNEMAQTLPALRARLAASPWYPTLFERAFGTSDVTDERIARALAQFVRTIVGTASKYDIGLAAAGNVNPGQVPFANFTAEENLGKAVFFDPQRGGCAGCHQTASFSLNAAADDGLDLVPRDSGLAVVTRLPGDVGRFKVSSLRNVGLRAPYMHDGRFATLERVVQHYSTGVQASPNLAPQLRGPGGVPRRPNFSAQESAALVAFLQTLTDPTLQTDDRWTNPFRR